MSFRSLQQKRQQRAYWALPRPVQVEVSLTVEIHVEYDGTMARMLEEWRKIMASPPEYHKVIILEPSEEMIKDIELAA